jgi:hypothetical protein
VILILFESPPSDQPTTTDNENNGASSTNTHNEFNNDIHDTPVETGGNLDPINEGDACGSPTLHDYSDNHSGRQETRKEYTAAATSSTHRAPTTDKETPTERGPSGEEEEEQPQRRHWQNFMPSSRLTTRREIRQTTKRTQQPSLTAATARLQNTITRRIQTHQQNHTYNPRPSYPRCNRYTKALTGKYTPG